jgi:Putative metallopeptidase
MERCPAAPLALLLIGLAAVSPHAATAQAQVAPGTIADNDSIFIDGTTFTVTAGRASTETSGLIKMLGARKLQPSALVFRSGRDLYIVDAPLRITDANGRNVYVNAERERTDRIRIEYVPPKNEEQQSVHDKLKERGALEMVQKLFSPFRLPADLTVRATGCDGFINAWYQRDETGPTVTICYEYIQHIMKNSPMETTPDGITRMDAVVGQFLFVVAHEIGHALFELYSVPVFGREEDAADQMAAYFMLHLGKENARGLIGGAAYAYHGFIKDYKENPDVRVPLLAFSSNHGSPEERYYNLMCMAYGADPTLFADVVENGMLPKTRARGCNYEFKTLRHAVLREIRPHLDFPMAQEIWNMRWIPDASLRTVAQE